MKRSKISKAMVLCAGLGTRLLPVTEKFPKPLVPVLNVPNLAHTLFLLRKAGIEEVIINTYHLPRLLEDYLGDGQRCRMKAHYSRESVLLGTGGGLKKAEAFFAGEPFVLANCDFITNVDLFPLIQQHLQRQAIATMVLLKDDTLQPLYSKVGVDENGCLCSLPSCQTRTPSQTGIFTGIHILENEVLQHLKEVPCGINEVLYPRLMKESPSKVFAPFMKDSYWFDTGDVPAFWSTSMKLLERLANGDGNLKELLSLHGKYVEKRPGIWLPEDVSVPAGVELVGPVILDRSVSLGKASRLGPFTILDEGAVIGEDARLSHFVGLGGARVSSGESCDGGLQFQAARLPLKKAKSAS